MVVSIACQKTGKVVYASVDQLYQIPCRLGIKERNGVHYFEEAHLIIAEVPEAPSGAQFVRNRDEIANYLRPKM